MLGVGLLVACGGGVGEESAVDPLAGSGTVTELSQQASELSIGMTTEEVLALLGPPSWALTSEDASEFTDTYSFPSVRVGWRGEKWTEPLPLLLVWKNGNCNPVEVRFSVAGEALAWEEGNGVCLEANYPLLPEDAFACPRTDSQFLASPLSDACASDAEQVDATPQADALSGFAHYQLAEQYASGVGVLQNDEEALRHYRLSAELGDDAGLYALGEVYEEGVFVPTDMAEAIRLWELAAESGGIFSRLAMIKLSRTLLRREYRNRVESYMWLVLALSRMDPQDPTLSTWVNSRERQSRALSDDQRSEAQRLAREWNEAHPPE